MMISAKCDQIILVKPVIEITFKRTNVMHLKIVGGVSDASTIQVVKARLTQIVVTFLNGYSL